MPNSDGRAPLRWPLQPCPFPFGCPWHCCYFLLHAQKKVPVSPEHGNMGHSIMFVHHHVQTRRRCLTIGGVQGLVVPCQSLLVPAAFASSVRLLLPARVHDCRCAQLQHRPGTQNQEVMERQSQHRNASSQYASGTLCACRTHCHIMMHTESWGGTWLGP